MAQFLDKAGLTHFWSKIKALLDSKSNTGHKHSYQDLNDKPTIPTITIKSWTNDDVS